MKITTLIVGVPASTPPAGVAQLKAALADAGIPAVVIAGATSLATVEVTITDA